MTLGCTIRIKPAAGRWLTALAAASLVAGSARAQETVPIHFSKPFEPILSTNLNALVGADKQKSFQELLKETDARGVSGLFRDDAPMGVVPLPSRPRMSPAAAQKYREAAERKKNWAFTIENEAESDPKIGRLMKFLDADAQAEAERQRSVYEKFYERLEREGRGGGAGDPLNPNQRGAGSDLLLPNSGNENRFGGLNLPGNDSGGESLPGSSLPGEARKLADSRPRDTLNLAARREALSTAATRQATDFKEYERDSSLAGLSTPAQRARLDAFKSLFDSKPSASVAAAAQAKAASPLSSAMSGLGLPSSTPGLGLSSPAAKGGFLERFDAQPGWKPAAPVSSPLPNLNNTFPSTPSRSTTPFPTVPTRRQ